MKFACNYSPQLMDLLARGDAAIDFIKAGVFGTHLTNLPAMLAARPVLLHGFGNNERTGMPDYRALDFERMNAFLLKYGSPHLGIHLAMTNADAGGFITDAEIVKRMTACARYFQERICVPLLLENIGDSPDERETYDLIPFVEPEKISRVINETGAGLLLDIAHAKVAAQFRGWEFHTYLMSLPLDRVREVHVSGPGLDSNGAPYDAHNSLSQDDYNALEWVLGRANPDIVTLEYGWPEADADTLLEQIKRIYNIMPGRQY